MTVRLTFALFAVLAVSPCRASESVAPTTPTPSDVAKRWLMAVHAKDTAALTALSHLPFTDGGLHDTKCKAKKMSTTPAELNQLLGCLVKDDTLVETIPADAKYLEDFKVRPLNEITHKAFIKKLTPLAKDHAIVTGGISGDGLTYEIAFAIRPDGTVDTVFGYIEAVE